MKTNQQRSDIAYSAVLAHASYACLQSEDFDTQLTELLKGIKVLCGEYNIDIAEVLNADEEPELRVAA
jgi:patatin-like phospholipase/acyl hydrolase